MITRTISLCLVSLALVLASCSNNSQWNRMGLNGKAKRVIETYNQTSLISDEWQITDIENYMEYSFDKKGILVATDIYNEDNELIYKLVPVYNHNDMIEQEFYNGDGELQNKMIYKNSSRNLIGFSQVDENDDIIGAGTIFMEKGRPIKEIHEARGYSDEVLMVLYEYDNKGLVVKQVYVDQEGDTTMYRKYKYLDYDNRRNWIRRLDYHSPLSEQPEYLVIRKIEYN